MTIIIVALAAVVLAIVCIIVGLYCFVQNYVVLDRNAVVPLDFPIKYLPDIIPEEEEIITNSYVLTGQDRRSIRNKRNQEFMRNQRAKKWPRKNKVKKGQPPKKPCFSFCCCCKSSHIGEAEGARGEEEEDDDDDDDDDENKDDDDTKKGRYISEEGLLAREARKALYGQKTEVLADVEETEEFELIAAPSLLDIDGLRQERVNELLAERIEDRKKKKDELKSANKLDSVAVNSGPPPEFWPEGYRPSSVVPKIDDSLVKKKIMYLWEGNRQSAGWHLGSISGVSRKSGCNYSVKYDRWITKNVFVDGVANYMLSLVGDDAYGRRWVTLEPIPGSEENV